MDSFVRADLETDALDSVDDRGFDLVMMSHVIEHLHNGDEVVSRLAGKLRPGGYLYLECPSERSLRLPSGVDSLNFFDDPSHVRIYNLRQVCIDAGLYVIDCGIRRDTIRAALGATILLPKQAISLVRHRKLYGPALWDLVGFAQYAIAQFRESSPEPIQSRST
jgi:SAM-dependent methyltransferase